MMKRVFDVTYPNGTKESIMIYYDGNIIQQLEKLKEHIFNSLEIEAGKQEE
jgi:hypothetical protein